MSYMDGMSEGSVTMRIVWVSGKSYNDSRFLSKKENKGAGRRVTRSHIVLGAGLMPNDPEFRGTERPELYESCEGEENL